MARFYVGPWIWDMSGPSPFWRAPTDTVRALDLRSLADQAIPGTTVNGNGLFVMPDAAAPGADYVEAPESFTGAVRNRLRTKLQLAQPIESAGNVAFVLELLTRHASVDGSTFARPLLPNRLGRLRLAFDAVNEDRVVDTSSVFWPKIQAAIHVQYRDYRERAGLTLPEDFHRKYLTVLLEKYRGRIEDYHQFIPSDLPDESPLPHSTTLTESFNKADSTTLGPDQTWTEVRGAFKVFSNQCTVDDVVAVDSADTGEARAEADLAGDDHYAQIVRVTNPTTNFQGGGPYARVSASANTGYGYLQRGSGASGVTELFKIVTGTRTQLDTATAAGTTNVLVKLEVDGSTQTGTQGGSADVSATDTAITGHTRAGMHRYDNGNAGIETLLFDNWEAADLAAAGNPHHYYAQMRRQ